MSDDSPRFLIVRLSSLGDVLRFLPLAASLRRHDPTAQITWATTAAHRELVEMCPHVAELLILDVDPHAPLRANLGRLAKDLPRLRARRYSAAIDAHGTVLSNAVVALARARRRLGIDRPNHFGLRPFAYLPVDTSAAPSPVDYHLSVLARLGVERFETGCDLDPGAAATSAAASLLTASEISPAERLVVVHPGTSLAVKQWPAERFASLADLLAAQVRVRVVVVAGDADRASFEIVDGRCGRAVVRASGLSLRELAALLQRAALVIGLDSGPLHLAAAMGAPTLGIFGPSDPGVSTPYGSSHRLARAALPCMPCFHGFDFHRQCPLGTRACLNDLAVEDVARTAFAMLGPDE